MSQEEADAMRDALASATMPRVMGLAVNCLCDLNQEPEVAWSLHCTGIGYDVIVRRDTPDVRSLLGLPMR